jgi:hypothetical protein
MGIFSSYLRICFYLYPEDAALAAALTLVGPPTRAPW